MKRIDAVIIGGGQAGLAVSRHLGERGIDHVILERGRVAQRWTERWDSLRLLTPNWMTRLPGWRYSGAAEDGFMKRDEVTRFLRAYARSFDAPVIEQTSVMSVEPSMGRWRVVTDRGEWLARTVVVATGHCHASRIPEIAAQLSPRITQIGSSEYRNPRQLPDGGVLVVGGSASGVQIADELRRSGREVVLAAGSHRRVPRRYRGRDIFYWLDRTGALSRPLSDLPDRSAGLREQSLQLVGNDAGEDLDFETLSARGVRITGRLCGFDGARARFSPDLARSAGEADAQLARLLSRIDAHIAAHGLDRELPKAEAPRPTPAGAVPRELDLGAAGIRSVVWATGYRRSYPWLRAAVLGADGEIRQTRGRTVAPGLYTIGLQFMIRRNSSFIDGVGRDAAEVAGNIARFCGAAAGREAA